ncbi:MAG: hypothetical protein IJN21_08055 [Clostridia bacterium]|nr:hypothetical protein [Clostridia bacterium]
MENNRQNPIDIDSLMDEIEDRIEEMIEEQVEDSVEDAMQNRLQEMIGEALSDMEITLANGAVIRPPKRMLLLSPDKTKMLLCYGGLRVDGCTLMIHTRISCWESIYVYPTREEAIEALVKVKNAMLSGAEIFEL